MKKITLIFISLFLFSAALQANNNEFIKNALVKIYTVSNSPNYYQPWQMVGQEASSGSGCVIANHRVLTNAHVISNATFVQVNKAGETKKYVAHVAAVDHECDLAILAVDDKDFFNNSTVLSLGDVPEPGDTVKAYGFPVGGEKLSVTEGVVSRIEIGQYSHSLRNFLKIQIDAAINPGNSGGPVMKNDKIIGVAFQGKEDAQGIGYAIPSLLVKHFLKDLQDKKYEGFPTLGVNFQSLENESYRLKMGLKKSQTGVVVDDVEFGSPAYGIIKNDDVILAVNGTKIENDGTVPYGSRGRLDMSFITDMKYVGDKISIDLLRDKKPVKVPVVMKNYTPIIPRTEYDAKPSYYIVGGLVFTKFTVNYIYAIWGNSNCAPGILERRIYESATPGKRELVVLIQVLADEINKGYHDFANLMVLKVNGQDISGMKDLIEKVNAVKTGFVEFELENKTKILLETDKIAKGSQRILGRYNIEADRSEDLK
jgi:S1-C subfamily serine protease